MIDLVVRWWPLLLMYFDSGFSQRCFLSWVTLCLVRPLPRSLMSDRASQEIMAPPPSSMAPWPTSQLSKWPLSKTTWQMQSPKATEVQTRWVTLRIRSVWMCPKNPVSTENGEEYHVTRDMLEATAALPRILLAENPVSWPDVPSCETLSDQSKPWHSVAF